MSTTISCRDVAEKLRGTLALHGGRRTGSLTVLYELVDGDGLQTFHTQIRDGVSRFGEGALDYEACDIVIHATPLTLHRILSGELAGREAIMSGGLEIRKAPSMSKLLVLRSLFARYMKAQRRSTRGKCTVENPRASA